MANNDRRWMAPPSGGYSATSRDDANRQRRTGDHAAGRASSADRPRPPRVRGGASIRERDPRG